ncbi:MAG: HisA/HisF-related TIM barrel protein [Thermoplasmatales archaeon]|nr:HisA/HisF-related TIM barrel protein [Thermoplasmatales archaeon]
MPFIPVLNGNVVSAEGSRYKKLGNAVKTVESSKYETFYVIDINGLIKNRPQINLIQEMSKEKNLWVESGVRFAEDMVDVLMAGAEYAVLNSVLVNLDELKKICALSQNIMLKLCNTDFNVICDGKVQSTFPSILGIFRENSVISRPKQFRFLWKSQMGFSKDVRNLQSKFRNMQSLLHLECKNSRIHGMSTEYFANKAEEIGIKKFVIESRDYWVIKTLPKNVEAYVFGKKDEVKKLEAAGATGMLLDIQGLDESA